MTQNAKTAVLSRPSNREAKAIEAVLGRRTERLPRVRANLSQTKLGYCELTPPHSDPVGWQARLENALGTCSRDFLEIEIRRLATVLRNSDGNVDTCAVDAAFAVLDGAQPKNEIEGMLVLQMAVTHALAMKKAATLNRANTLDQQDSAGLALMRLNRTFTAQIEALATFRRGGRQKMTVEHVHVYPGAQAIVGNVTHAKEGHRYESSEQPHGTDRPTAAVFAESAAVRSPEPQRDSLPVARSEGEKALPNARRSAGQELQKGSETATIDTDAARWKRLRSGDS